MCRLLDFFQCMPLNLVILFQKSFISLSRCSFKSLIILIDIFAMLIYIMSMHLFKSREKFPFSHHSCLAKLVAFPNFFTKWMRESISGMVCEGVFPRVSFQILQMDYVIGILSSVSGTYCCDSLNKSYSYPYEMLWILPTISNL